MSPKLPQGILNLDKPPAWTSHDVVARVRRLIGVKRVGHAGTLDPLATGVLLVCVGQATRVSEYLMRSHKHYRATLRLGIETDTHDADGSRGQPSGNRDRDQSLIGRGVSATPRIYRADTAHVFSP